MISQLPPVWIVTWDVMPRRRLHVQPWVTRVSAGLRCSVQIQPEWRSIEFDGCNEFDVEVESEYEPIVGALENGDIRGKYGSEIVWKLLRKYVLTTDQPDWLVMLLPAVAEQYNELRFGP